ncbi:MAG: hypothetical protein E7553_07465 [Ruminococcaceae bacterium]|nr:hypothetical protein [Oscillospiraceae bacterium]
MGKGSRKREANANKCPAYELPLRQAEKLDRLAAVLGVLAVILLALSLFLPSWSVHIIAQNLAAGTYSADEAAALTPVLPLGRLSLILLSIGTVLTFLLLKFRKTALSLIGLAADVAASAMLIAFAVTLGSVFAFNPVLHSGHGQGLSFWELVLRYYILLLPVIMQIVAVCVSFAAHKKRDIADVMKNASDTTSTLSLDDEESDGTLS